MSEYKKHEPVEEFKRSTNNNRQSKSREASRRVYGLKKGVFLTDTQTSDYTKSSGEMQMMKIEYLEGTVKNLQKENGELKQTILNLKAN